ncbi:MAG TPA: CRTAC1 family protein [Vicinamibacteria bacterium]|nr:CRTAC1 family protein [Vicinamibacteria bacterium]
MLHVLLPPASGAGASRVRFTDATEAAGLTWGIRKVAAGGWNLVETMGGGGGFVDFDGDGWLDVYLVSYSLEPQPMTGKTVGDALYRNNRDGTFTDVTQRAGIDGRRRGMGLAVGDYDDDGREDLFVSGYDTSVLYHNEGGGRFRDATDRAGVRGKLWGCSATFLDYDRDGRLDLFVSDYLEYDPDHPGRSPCRMYDDYPFCTIAKFVGQPSVLYHNKGDGTFEDASASSGISAVVGKGMAVAAADLDDDGWIDVFQTNDSTPNFLFRNLGGGRFREVGLEAEVAFDPSGQVTGAMGTDVEDVDGDGRLDLLVTNFNHYGTFLHSNTGGMRFVDRGSALGLSMPTFNTSVFGARFLDVDDDGLIDLFMASGHPFAPVSKVWPGVHFSDPPFLFHNDGTRFTDVAPEAGDALRRAYAGRGVAVGDFDNDGDPDVLMLCMGEPPRLFRNDTAPGAHWVGLQLVGTRSGHDAIGARVTLTAGGRARTRARVGGGSYLTASDPRLLFGLGETTRVDSLEVRWPSGLVERFPPPAVDRYSALREGSGTRPKER